MTTTTDRIGPGDLRRAAALLTHHANSDAEGGEAVIAEAEVAGRLRQLVWSVPSVLAAAQPPGTWHTPANAALLRHATACFADLEAEGAP